MTDRKHTTQDQKRAKAAKAAEQPAAEPAAAGEAAEAQIAEAAAQAIADELAGVMRERDEYLDHLRRLKAEWDNYRKRVQRDNEEQRLRAAETVVESLLPVMDNMSRALEAGDKHGEGQLVGRPRPGRRPAARHAGGPRPRGDRVAGHVLRPRYHEAIVPRRPTTTTRVP